MRACIQLFGSGSEYIPAGGQISIIQSPPAVFNLTSPTTSSTFSVPVTPGKRLVAAVTSEGPDLVPITLSVSDPTNGAWTLDFFQEALEGHTPRVGFFSVLNAGSTALTVTATASGGTPAAQAIRIYELSGIATASYIEDTDFVHVDDGTMTAQLVTVTPNCFALIATPHYPDIHVSPDTGFTPEGADQAWNYYHNLERRTSLAAGTTNLNWNGGTLTGFGAIGAIAYRPG